MHLIFIADNVQTCSLVYTTDIKAFGISACSHGHSFGYPAHLANNSVPCSESCMYCAFSVTKYTIRAEVRAVIEQIQQSFGMELTASHVARPLIKHQYCVDIKHFPIIIERRSIYCLVREPKHV